MVKTAPKSSRPSSTIRANAQAPEVLQHRSALGTTFLGSATVPLTVAGLDGLYSVRAYSTKQGTDFTDIPQLLLPPQGQSTIAPEAKVGDVVR